MTLQEAVETYVAAANATFTTDDAVGWVKSRLRRRSGALQKAVIGEIEKSDLVLYDEELNHYVPCKTFFHNARFRIAPTEEEIKQGILFPGHRFIPFISRQGYPPDCTLVFPNGQKPGLKAVTRRCGDIFIYVSLFGFPGALEYITLDHEENMDSLDQVENPFEATVTLTVFDMAEIYGRYGFKSGDSFIVTVEDWVEGRYSLEHAPAPDIKGCGEECRAWCRMLEDSLEDVFEELGAATDIHEQLSIAFFRGDPALLRTPAIHIGGFLTESKDVDMAEIPMGTILWHKGESPTEALFRDADPFGASMKGNKDSIGAILKDIGLSLNEGEVEAYMRDELFRGGNDLGAVLARCLAGLHTIHFYDEKQESAFQRMFDALWRRLVRSYNRSKDQEPGALRSGALQILDKQMLWLRMLDQEDLDPEDLPEELMVHLGAAMGLLTGLIDALNRPSDEDREDIAGMAPMLKKLEVSIDSMMDSIDKAIGRTKNPTLRLVSGSKPATPEIYQIKISLKDIRPPIWRRVQVESSTSLAGFHQIVQIAMGWTDSHLHQFSINDVEYGNTEFDEFDEIEDEETVFLCDLAMEAGDKFEYEYDFGDGWRHVVELEKILPPESDEGYPRCLKGKRACPREDCGGPGGYQNLIDILQDPEREEYEDMHEWVGEGFDPEAFDLGKTNTLLRRGY